MDDVVFNEIRMQVTERFNVIERRLNNHGDRLDKLEQKQVEFCVKIDNLCASIDKLISTIKWVIGLTVPAAIGIVAIMSR